MDFDLSSTHQTSDLSNKIGINISGSAARYAKKHSVLGHIVAPIATCANASSFFVVGRLGGVFEAFTKAALNIAGAPLGFEKCKASKGLGQAVSGVGKVAQGIFMPLDFLVTGLVPIVKAVFSPEKTTEEMAARQMWGRQKHVVGAKSNYEMCKSGLAKQLVESLDSLDGFYPVFDFSILGEKLTRLIEKEPKIGNPKGTKERYKEAIRGEDKLSVIITNVDEQTYIVHE